MCLAPFLNGLNCRTIKPKGNKMETLIVSREYSADKHRAALIAQNVPGCLEFRLCLINHEADEEKAVNYIQRPREDFPLLLKMSREFCRAR